MVSSPALLLFLLSLTMCRGCERLDKFRNFVPMSAEKRVVRAGIAVKALMTGRTDDPENPGGFIAELWILDVYKGAEKLAAALGLPSTGVFARLKDQRLNVSGWGDSSLCQSSPVTQKTYVVLLTSKGKSLLVARYDDPFGAAIDFSADTEKRMLEALGWQPWSDWGPCSQSCRGGQQTRTRKCGSPSTRCPSYNIERRSCNNFKCTHATNALRVQETRYFKPSPSAFHRVAGRSADAWLIRPGSYFLLPFKQAFGKDFPRDFTVFLTLRPTEESEGIIFSINARNSRQEYISLELNEGRLELVHSMTANGSKVIDIPARVSDGAWHQLAISVDGGSSVRTYLDCRWITTQVLHLHSLNVPENADLIIGYMFQGEIDQLTVSDERGSVSEQCSPTRVPFAANDELDNDIDIQEEEEPDTKTDDKVGKTAADYIEEEYVDLDWSENEEKSGRRDTISSKAIIKKDSKSDFKESSKMVFYPSLSSSVTKESSGVGREEDEDLDGSGRGEEGSGSLEFEIEWSSWGDCSAKCDETGRQFRTSRCQDNGRMEECIAAGRERAESRTCRGPKCRQQQQQTKAMKKDKSNPSVRTVTGKDVEKTRTQHISKSKTISVEENTNMSSRVPNYWVPDQLKKVSQTAAASANASAACVGARCKRCRPECSNGGRCVADEVCACPSGYTGARCQQAFCHPGCQNGGTCVAPFQCSCPEGMEGASCERFSCQPMCANGGVCLGRNSCSCPHGFSGAGCRERTCSAQCENGGVCVMGDKGDGCRCRIGFYGARCQKRKCDRYVSVREPHRRAFQRSSACAEGDEACIKKSKELSHKTVYRTTYKCAGKDDDDNNNNQ